MEKEYIEKLLAASEDARMLKLADRLDTYRCLEFNVKKNPIKYIMQTQEHYFPLAHGSNNPRIEIKSMAKAIRGLGFSDECLDLIFRVNAEKLLERRP